MEGPQLNIWAVLILLGVSHGLFLAVVLWFKKQNRNANRVFALLILSITYHLFDYAMSISGMVFQMPHLMLSSYPLLFVIAPLFYLYILSFLNGGLSLDWKIGLHFIPAVLLLILFLPFYLKPGSYKIDYLLSIGASGFEEVPGEQFVIMGAQVIQLFIYLLFSYRLVNQRYQLYQMRKANQVKKFRWLNYATLVLLSFVILYAIFLVLLIVNKQYRVETDYVIAVTLSMLLFAAGYVALVQPELFAEGLNGNGRKLLKEEASQSVKSRLENWMGRKKPYLLEDLKISDLAEALDIPIHHLSEVINQEYQLNFFDFVNQYRIEEAKRLLVHPEYQDQKILAIAFDTGFSNKGTFNRVFKKFTGQTPSAYRKKYSD